ncbi:DUF3806 domain-containing protein [Peristeroidobacter agariperforans]|uniref:DUF3806 domain-containing protein n=1 Tax=Peristeroidobacter agariperforans TaxID=268404 RepID=UPI001300AD0D|nr:DUF3806 domain-containing protein [Peristeroidobacter agariperforans]
MAIISNIIDALRKFGSATQKTALQRQDEQLDGKRVIDRRRYVARSELGQSSQFVATTEAEPETIVPLTERELAPILENAALVEDFVVAFLGTGLSDQLLDNLDSAFGAWMRATDKKGYSDEAVIEIAGAAFGAFCAQSLDMRWIRLTDNYGTALALQGRSKDFRGFPYQAISKRIPSREYGFFKPIYISLQDAARRDWKPTDAA